MGKDLLDTMVAQTDLPKELLEKELNSLLSAAQISASDLNLESLRKLMANYLQDVFTEAKKEFVIEE